MKKVIVIVLIFLLILETAYTEETIPDIMEYYSVEENEFGEGILYFDNLYTLAYLEDGISICIPPSVDDCPIIGIGDYAFYETPMIQSVSISEGIKYIGEFAFAVCNDLERVYLPNSVSAIHDFAFSGSAELSVIDFGEHLEYIGDYVFESCLSLNSVTIPDSVISIGKNPFSRCDALSNIKVDSNNTNYCVINEILYSIKENRVVSFPAGSPYNNIDLPDGVLVIGEDAFCGSNVQIVTIPTGAVIIEDGAFQECLYLRQINIPESVIQIGVDAFNYCEGLTLLVKRGSFAEEYAIKEGIN